MNPGSADVLTSGKLYRESLCRHWLLYGVGTFSLVMTSVTEVLTPKFAQWGIDLLTHPNSAAVVPAWFKSPSPHRSLALLVTGLVLTILIGWVGRVIWRQTLARRSHQAGRDLKVGIWESLRHEPLRTFQRYSLGDIMNRATGDLNAGRSIHGFTIVLTYDMVFLAILGTFAVIQIDWQLAALSFIAFPILPRFILKLARREYSQHVWAQEKLSGLSDLVSQSLGTMRLQRATASEKMWEDALKSEARAYAERRFQVLLTGLKMFPLVALPTLIAYGVLLFFGVRKIANGELTIGQFVALQSYVMLLQIPLLELGDVIAEWQRGFASLDRIVELLNLRRRPGQKSSMASPASVQSQEHSKVVEATSTTAGSIAIKALSLSFPNMNQPVFSALSLDCAPRSRTGICGPIGTGKTSILAAVAGLIDVPVGRVFIDGHDVTQVSRGWLTERVALVPQKAFLFAGSIRYNLCLADTYSDEQLWEVLDTVQLASEIKNLPEGLETWIGEWGITLSGGQKQRLALARALLRPKSILLLDDCLSAVDAVTEEAILEDLAHRLVNVTVLWVAHRPSTLKLCERIYRLTSGGLQ